MIRSLACLWTYREAAVRLLRNEGWIDFGDQHFDRNCAMRGCQGQCPRNTNQLCQATWALLNCGSSDVKGRFINWRILSRQNEVKGRQHAHWCCETQNVWDWGEQCAVSQEWNLSLRVWACLGLSQRGQGHDCGHCLGYDVARIWHIPKSGRRK